MYALHGLHLLKSQRMALERCRNAGLCLASCMSRETTSIVNSQATGNLMGMWGGCAASQIRFRTDLDQSLDRSPSESCTVLYYLQHPNFFIHVTAMWLSFWGTRYGVSKLCMTRLQSTPTGRAWRTSGIFESCSGAGIFPAHAHGWLNPCCLKATFKFCRSCDVQGVCKKSVSRVLESSARKMSWRAGAVL